MSADPRPLPLRNKRGRKSVCPLLWRSNRAWGGWMPDTSSDPTHSGEKIVNREKYCREKGVGTDKWKIRVLRRKGEGAPELSWRMIYIHGKLWYLKTCNCIDPREESDLLRFHENFPFDRCCVIQRRQRKPPHQCYPHENRFNSSGPIYAFYSAILSIARLISLYCISPR